MYQQRSISPQASIGILDLKAFSEQMNLQGKRAIEKAGSRYVLQQLLSMQEIPLVYNVFNKPSLRDHPAHISISHSHDKLAVVINFEQATGVDIELIRDKVLNIRHKFLSENELSEASDDVPKLITYWAAKESLYKVYGEKELDFSKHLCVAFLGEQKLKGSISVDGFEKHFLMQEEQIDNYKLVYILHEI